MKDKVNIKEKFQLFKEHWTPKILGEVNDSYVKVFKTKGDFVWHKHEKDDEFFLVVKGSTLYQTKKWRDCFERGRICKKYGLDEIEWDHQAYDRDNR